MVAIIANRLHVESELALGHNEDGQFHYIAGWRVMLDEVIGEGIGPRQNKGDGVKYWSHNKLWESKEAAEEFVERMIDSGRTEINEQHWTNIGEDFRTWDDIEFEWNSFAEQERTNG